MGPVRQMLRQVRLVFNQRGCLCVDRKAPSGAGWFFGVLHAFESTAPQKLTAIQRVIRAVAVPILGFGGVSIAGLPLPSLLRQVTWFAPGVRVACPRPDHPS